MPKSPWPIWTCSRAESASRPAADRLRRRLAAALASCAIIPIVAHTDDLGSASLELAWGQERLDAVRRRLEESGIAAGRIRSLNHGSESNSAQECADEDCRRFRRRVDFLFHKPAKPEPNRCGFD